MPTSGSTDHNATRNQVIASALELCGSVVGAADQSPDTNEIYASTARALNDLVKHLRIRGMPAWLQATATVFLDAGKYRYTLGSAGDRATRSYVKTEVRVAAAAAAVTLEVLSTTGILGTHTIGVELTNGTMHWTTVNVITDADTLTLTVGLPSGASVGGFVYAYATKLSYAPQKLSDAYWRSASETDTLINIAPRSEYNAISNKASASSPVQVTYERDTYTAVLALWPAPDSVRKRLVIEYQREIEDFDASADIPDFPSHYIYPITYLLAARVAPIHGFPLSFASYLGKVGEAALELSLDSDSENTYIDLKVDLSGH